MCLRFSTPCEVTVVSHRQHWVFCSASFLADCLKKLSAVSLNEDVCQACKIVHLSVKFPVAALRMALPTRCSLDCLAERFVGVAAEY